MESIIEIKNVYYQYEKDYVLENISLSIPKGAFLAIVGPNGSGKSTLLKLILGLLKVQTGKIYLFGQEQGKFKDWQKIGYVSQKANSFNTGFPATVFEVVASGLTKKMGIFKVFKKEHSAQVVEAVEAVGMRDFIHRNIGELSGGQQQRVFIARALVSEPELLILDEPTVGVDVENVNNFYQMLAHLNKNKGITLLMVTHDIGTVSDKVSHVACLNKHLHFHGDTNQFEQMRMEEMSKVYGHDVHLLTHHHEHGGARQ
ncbi:metal ABC transporter ATP-binding protein [Neobacillus thermocopriae]|uniref:Metal ABC transporter ATP-binding protein n=1 Tax=Neobacillus thermocopriae TaxID=1215031 RepID=A0A6B3TSA4_9BACI|nr:metal ABC transporter ATP-binding protein [Neobacillus thermocopriae]MED3624793.1 metal ABC transporter ATP-binding protein [Neobacillus thermocopriae]MED3715487.1 metal ABC transporter ATP-binding protein [Neobacillus thermocopriae]NEX79693.1 metal ABC transporter ATP-binding protein [Neobacillus thermocopriae]